MTQAEKHQTLTLILCFISVFVAQTCCQERERGQRKFKSFLLPPPMVGGPVRRMSFSPNAITNSTLEAEKDNYDMDSNDDRNSRYHITKTFSTLSKLADENKKVLEKVESSQRSQKKESKRVDLLQCTVNRLLQQNTIILNLLKSQKVNCSHSRDIPTQDIQNAIVEEAQAESGVGEEPFSADISDGPSSAMSYQELTELRENENPILKKTAQTNSPKRYRPKRPCLFCNNRYRDIANHLEKAHKDREEVKSAIKLPPEEKRSALKLLRIAGIKKENIKILEKGGSLIYQRNQNQKQTNMVECEGCHGLFSRKHFCDHKKKCPKKNYSMEGRRMGYRRITNPIYKNKKLEENFQREIIDKFRFDEIGNFIRTNEEICRLGFDYYEELQSRSRPATVKKTIMTHMRTIVKIFHKYLEIEPQQEMSLYKMFDKANTNLLNEVIRNLVESDAENNGKETKYAMQLTYGHAIKRASKSLKVIYDDLEMAEEFERVRKFQFSFDSKWAKNYRPAEASAFRAKSTKRLPENLPKAEDVEKLLNFVDEELKQLSSPFEFKNNDTYFRRLRKALLCKLTFFNGRRPTEVGDLEISGWKNAKLGTYIPKELLTTLSENDRKILGQFKIAYNCSKVRGEDISILFPQNTWDPMDFLTNSEIRNKAGVLPSNRYVFASTLGSSSYTSSWHDIKSCCDSAKVSRSICSDDNRHRIATEGGRSSMNSRVRDLFLKHLGHSDKINRLWYQSFPGADVILNIGPVLSGFERKKADTHKSMYVTHEEPTDDNLLSYSEAPRQNELSSSQDTHEGIYFSEEEHTDYSETPKQNELSSSQDGNNNLEMEEECITDDRNLPSCSGAARHGYSSTEEYDTYSDEDMPGIISSMRTHESSDEEGLELESYLQKRKRIPWSSKDKAALSLYFKDFIEGRKDKLNGSKEIPLFMKNYPDTLRYIECTPKSKLVKLRGQINNMRKLHLNKKSRKLPF